jgi:fatty acid desaturase
MSRAYFPGTRLRKQNPVRWLVALFADYGVIALAMAAAHRAFAFAQQRDFVAVPDVLAFAAIGLAVLAIGTRQHGILILGHDGSHGLVSRNVRWNDFLTNLLCFWPFGMGLSGYRQFHFAHHRHMGTTADPELIHKKKAAPTFDLPASPARILGLGVAAMFGEGILEEFFIVKYIIARESLRDIVMPIAMWTAFACGLWYFNASWIALVWFVALGSAFWAAFRMRVWTEHMGTADAHRIYARPLYRSIFLPHNTWYHFEHHRFPTVPFWNLHRARALDTETPVSTLETLFASYDGYRVIPSGMPASPVKQPEAAAIAA